MQVRHDDFIYIFRIDPGEKIMESLLGFLADKEKEIPSGFLTGIGATSSCEIGWYDLTDQEYKTHLFNENCEIASLVGNIAWEDGVPIVHAHIQLGRKDYSIIGGHLVDGTISVTGEIYLHISQTVVNRKPKLYKGLKLIEFQPE